MKHKCTACGHEDEINPGKLLGAIRTPKREAAWKKHGERLKKMFANARVVEEAGYRVGPGRIVKDRPAEDYIYKKTEPDLPPKPTTLEGKRAAALAALAGVSNRQGMSTLAAEAVVPDLSEVPHAPFDFEQEGETYRVRGERAGLGLYWLGEDGEQRKRSLAPGELESFWANRIIK